MSATQANLEAPTFISASRGTETCFEPSTLYPVQVESVFHALCLKHGISPWVLVSTLGGGGGVSLIASSYGARFAVEHEAPTCLAARPSYNSTKRGL